MEWHWRTRRRSIQKVFKRYLITVKNNFHFHLLLGNAAVELCHFMSEQDGHDLFSQTMAKTIPNASNPNASNPSTLESESFSFVEKHKRVKEKSDADTTTAFKIACESIANSFSSLASPSVPPSKRAKTISEEEERLYDLEMKISTLPEGATRNYFQRKRDELLSLLQ